MNGRGILTSLAVTLPVAACAATSEDVIVVSAYDGPPPAQDLTDILAGTCDGKTVQLRIVRGEPGRMTLTVGRRQIADLSDTPLGRDWTSRSLLVSRAMRCSADFVRLSAMGVRLMKDGSVQHVYSTASITEGRVTAYMPPQPIEPEVVGLNFNPERETP